MSAVLQLAVDAPDESATPDCQQCATCCFANTPRYIQVWGVDCDRLGELTDEVTSVVDGRRYLRMRDGRCAALRIDPATHRFACGIYERRPDACRWLERGSSHCHAQIAHKAERPLIAIEKLLRRPQSA
jgi:Fe-S-cluster containining protein